MFNLLKKDKGFTLDDCIETIIGIKMQAIYAESSLEYHLDRNRAAPDRVYLMKAHEKINAKVFSSGILKEYSQLRQLGSYVEINIDDFREWFRLNHS